MIKRSIAGILFLVSLILIHVVVRRFVDLLFNVVGNMLGSFLKFLCYVWLSQWCIIVKWEQNT